MEAAQRALDRVAQHFPVALEALIEAKTCAILGCLPEPGGLLEQTGGFAGLCRFLASRGILEGVSRGSL